MKRYVCMMMVLFVFIFTCACSASAEESATTSEPAAAAEESTAVAEETPATPEDPNRINYLILVNEENAIPDDWEANLNLAPTTNAEGYEIELEAEALEQFTKLHDALLEEDVDVEITTFGFVSVEAQQRIMDGFIEQWGEEYAKEYVTAPGYSEFHTGLALDFCFVDEGEIIDKDLMIEFRSEELSIVADMLPEYGFIVRYPEGKEDVTGHEFEPWHIRYVGSPEVAQEITDQGITLEEYLAK